MRDCVADTWHAWVCSSEITGSMALSVQPSAVEDETAPDGSRDQLLPILDDLKCRATDLLSELDCFRDHLRSIRQESVVEVAHYHGTVRSELAMLERLFRSSNPQASLHIARSSNLPFLETIWRFVKTTKGLVALHKRIYFKVARCSLPETSANLSSNSAVPIFSDGSCVVDAITQNGRTWVKVSLLSNTRLLFDLAKQGWEIGGPDSDNEDDEPSFPPHHEYDDHDVPLLKTTKELAAASASSRTRTRCPQVILVLPRIIEGETELVDQILAECRATGAVVICGRDFTPAPSITSVLDHIAPHPFSMFSDVLNIDCTILLALVSEFSHAKVSKEAWFHKALQRQVDVEGGENLLPSLLYPAMGPRGLVCTGEAVKRMREIVDAIGTTSEKARTSILMGDDRTKAQNQLVQEMQHWSAHNVPADWRLPIRVADQAEDDYRSTLPREAWEVTADMSKINKSVFLHGWATGRTTITSNRAAVRHIDDSLDKYNDLDDSTWPRVWLCPTARSLVGKEKRGVKREEGKDSTPRSKLDAFQREELSLSGLEALSVHER